MLTHIKSERFPRGTLMKLHSRKVGPFLLHRLDNNAYLLELPPKSQFNPISNVEDLIAYDGHDP